MSRRIIPCQVTDEYVRGSGVVVGAAGSHNDVALRLVFGPMWAGTARSIVWKDALGGNPTVTILGTDLLETGETEVYIVPIPAEPKALAGDLSMTIKGAVVEGVKETSATLTARAFFTVMESDWDEDAAESGDITPTQAEQMQAQIEEIKKDIVEASKAASALDETKKAQAEAENARDASMRYMVGAKEQAQISGSYADKASKAVSAAQIEVQRAASEADRAMRFADDANTKSESWAIGGTGSREGEDTNNAKYWAGFAQSQAESMTVPAAEGVYNVVLQDRAVESDRYALIVENGVLKLLGVKNTVDAATPTLIDNASGTGWKLAVENGKLMIEEV